LKMFPSIVSIVTVTSTLKAEVNLQIKEMKKNWKKIEI
jgi:hypothetical protein